MLRTAAATRARERELAVLGRFSAQLAHDLKNPLAALAGAGQFLLEEVRRGNPGPETLTRSLTLMLAQVDRLHGTIDRYQRLRSIEPTLARLDLNGLVARVLSLQAFVESGRARVRTALAPGLPPCLLDESLVGAALENLLANALEAIPAQGNVLVRSFRAGPRQPDGREAVVLSVEDDGVGMDVRTLERAFEEFHTTKATGTGLGLFFVRRVVEAHGGAVQITSQLGRGTTVQVRFPAA